VLQPFNIAVTIASAGSFAWRTTSSVNGERTTPKNLINQVSRCIHTTLISYTNNTLECKNPSFADISRATWRTNEHDAWRAIEQFARRYIGWHSFV
jgi:hypothetical protein